MLTDRLRQVANVTFAIGQLAIPPLLFSSGFDANVADTPRIADPNPATPAGYTFSIWGPIFIGAFLTACLQGLPRNQEDPLFRRIGWLTAAGYGLSCLWLLAARFGPLPLTPVILGGMLLTLGSAFVTVVRSPERLSLTRQLLVAGPLGLYAGYISAAVWVNTADVAPAYGFDRFGLSAEEFGAVTLLFGAGTALAFIARTRAYPTYVFAAVWALVGIWVANGAPSLEGAVASTAVFGIGLLLIASLTAWLLPRTRMRSSGGSPSKAR
jgi:hypothetical protein